ncbi:MAG: hypothetical protein EBW42_15655 [Rhodobacterales bacterium]|nr:hypothetical protein [Rhodobacterales bacterium]
MFLKMTKTLIATMLLSIYSAVQADEQDKSTSELYNGLLPKEQSALCAVSAIMIEPKDEPMSKLHLQHFREKANVLPIFSNGMLIAMGKKWIVDNGYDDRVYDVYAICKG